MDENKKLKVAILMATYNGEKFLENQIESVLNQTHKELVLIIRDDGSTDATMEILKKYAEKDNRIIILKNHGSKHGAYLNFWNLLHYAKGELNANYFFLSDQDDIWKLSKIESSIMKLKEGEENTSLLLYTDMEVIDEKGEIIYPSYNGVMHIGNSMPQATFFTRNIFWGCTMAFNAELLREIPLISLTDSRIGIMSHDTYLAEFASLFGKVFFLDKVTIGHRKHSQNVTGQSTLKYNMTTTLEKITSSSFDEKAKKHARTYAQSLTALEIFRNNALTNEETTRIWNSIIKGGIKGCIELLHYKVVKTSVSRTVLTYIVMLTKTYKKHIPEWLNRD